MKVTDLERINGKLPAYAWPGGYPIIYFTCDGLTVCADCASREIDQAQEVIAAEVYYEGPALTCEDCEKTQIESAYGDPNERETQ